MQKDQTPSSRTITMQFDTSPIGCFHLINAVVFRVLSFWWYNPETKCFFV